MKTIMGLMLTAILGACQAREAEPAANEANDATTAQAAPAAPSAPTPRPVSPAAPAAPNDSGAPGTPGGLPDDRTLLPEPKGPIDPKSAEAAGQVLQTYGALLEERKFGQAWAMWGGGGDGDTNGMTRDQFAAAFSKYRDIHAEVGKPGDTEGAAGSIYVEVPFRLYGTLKAGGRFNLVGPVTLRRVNDVDGSTAEQRRWHIASIALKPTP